MTLNLSNGTVNYGGESLEITKNELKIFILLNEK